MVEEPWKSFIGRIYEFRVNDYGSIDLIEGTI